jgi:hypothetical protein
MTANGPIVVNRVCDLWPPFPRFAGARCGTGAGWLESVPAMVTPAQRIRLNREVFHAGELDAWVARMSVLRGDEITAIVDVRLGRRRRGELLGPAGSEDEQGKDRLKAALVEFAVRRLDETLRQGVILPAEITVQQDDVPLLQSMLADRSRPSSGHARKD